MASILPCMNRPVRSAGAVCDPGIAPGGKILMTKATEAPKEDNAIVRYFKDTRAEISKVTWPTREEGIRLTLIVLAITVVSMIILFAVDSLFGAIVGGLISL
jgi:preprotein translocase subunit SecE